MFYLSHDVGADCARVIRSKCATLSDTVDVPQNSSLRMARRRDP